jgi:putative tricarboxylic transport membrane protein
MDFLTPLIGGVMVLDNVTIWVFIILGTIIGVIVGALPGVGATMTYGMLLPFTFTLDTEVAIALLLAISVGNAFGNSIPAILMGIPGSPSAILTVIDGYNLHKKGESGLALAVAWIAAMAGQAISILLFILMVVPLMAMAYYFGQPEQFALFLLGIVAIASLTGDNVVKGLVAGGIGFLIGIVGIDPNSPLGRFTFDYAILRAGFDVAPVMIGLLALSELLRSGRQVFKWDARIDTKTAAKFPPLHKLKDTIWPIIAGSFIGTFVSAIPGAGGTPASMISYQQAQLFAKRPEEFGKGSIEGLAANEAAQNASNSGEAAPALALGLPTSGSMVLLLAALTIHGFVPGPNMIRQTPELFYAAIGGMLAATLILTATGWHLGLAMLRLVNINRSIVVVVSIATVLIGVYSLSGKIFDVWVVLACGVIGYYMSRYGYSVAAAALAVVLGRQLERSLRLGLNLTDGDWIALLSRPYTGLFVGITILFLTIGIYRTAKIRKKIRAQAAEAAAQV